MRALALFSGGLDSVLSMKLIIDQNIDVIAIHIDTGFGSASDKTKHMQNMCDQIGASLKILNLKDEFLNEVLFEPKYGYGKNFNPCVDCHGFMFRYTKKLLQIYEASFMISGEVLGQRPMSQRYEAMNQVASLGENEDDLIVRPLCAKLLPITKPEKENWINREKLLDIQGRSRVKQLQMAKDIGLEGFESPSGGCLLTDISFSQRLTEFIKFGKLKVNDIDTIKFGRHFRLNDGAKLIVGRNKEDNKMIDNISNDNYVAVFIQDLPGPSCLLQKNATPSDKKDAIDIVISYAKTNTEELYSVSVDDKLHKQKKTKEKQYFQKFFV
ncbi:MAG: ATP-binding protein [Epsilonproteobacteria bacterium]|nr:MAG: ATP-binding protein [Campylobacterota bacterium]